MTKEYKKARREGRVHEVIWLSENDYCLGCPCIISCGCHDACYADIYEECKSGRMYGDDEES